MRTTLTNLLFITTAFASAQSYERVEVVSVDSTQSAAELYRTAERWFVDTFKDAQEVVQLRDTVDKTLVGKGSVVVHFSTTGMASISIPYVFAYTLEVQTKPGRFRYRLYDITAQSLDRTHGIIPSEPLRDDTCCRGLGRCEYMGGKKMAANLAAAERRMCAQIAAHREALITSLKAAMRKPQEDW